MGPTVCSPRHRGNPIAQTVMNQAPVETLGRRRFLSWVAGAVAGSAAKPAAAIQGDCRPHERPWIPSDSFIADLPRLMSIVSLPGIAMAVVEEGQVTWSRAFGVMNVETQARVTDETVFEVASLSKPAFAYVLMRLVDEGLLSLDRPLVQYRRPEYLSDQAVLEVITAKDVLRHTTGLPNWRSDPNMPLTADFTPRADFHYSGEGFFWLQLVVEKLTGQGLDVVMRSRLFGPANMPRSTYAWSAEEAQWSVYGYTGPGPEEGKLPFQSSRVIGNLLLSTSLEREKPIHDWTHDDVLRGVREVMTRPGAHQLPAAVVNNLTAKYPIHLFPNAAGSLRTTASEYARFMTLMMDRPKRAAWEISDASRRAMLTPQVVVRPNAIQWGLGWELERSRSALLFEHGGNNADIFKTFCVGDPVRGRAIVILTNGGGGPSVYQRAVRDATGLDLLEFMR